MSTSLFRQEVLQAQQGRWLGSIRIATRPVFTAVTLVSVLLAAALAAFAAFGQVQRKASVPGILVPAGGLIAVAAPQDGVVAQWLVGEGDAVRRGQAVVRIRSERHTDSGEAGQAARLALQRRRDSLDSELRLLEADLRQREQAAAERLRSLESEQRQLRQELDNLGVRLDAARRNQQRFAELVARGFVSPVQAQQRDDELFELLSRDNAARRGLEALERERGTLRAEAAARRTAWLANQEPLKRALALLAQEEVDLDARQGALVLAPQDGLVGSIARPAGHGVRAGQTVASIVTTATKADARDASSESPLGDAVAGARTRAGVDLHAHLYAPTRKAGFVRAGQAVWLRLDAYPYQKYGMARGVVAHVSDAPLAPEDLPSGQGGPLLAAAQSGEPLLRITVHLAQQHVVADGRRWPLRPSTTLEADVLQERRAVWEWLFEPLLAARERSKVLSSHPSRDNEGG